MTTHKIDKSLKVKELYNPESKEKLQQRRIYGGNPTSLFELNKIKYKWAFDLWKKMLNNTWFPEEVDMSIDRKSYTKELTEGERNSYDRALSQLIFMDSLQTNQLVDNLNAYITAPELNMCLVRQAYEESIHSQSYAVMVDGISDESDLIYELWRHDERLKNKNDKIADIYNRFRNNPTDKNLILLLYANQILEGVFFYCGFAYIYALSYNQKMLNSAKMIKFINRDEITHTLLFSKIIKTLKEEEYSRDIFKDYTFQQEVKELFLEGYELEKEWGQYIVNGEILGLTNESIDMYVKHLINERRKAVKEQPLFENTKMPYSWLKNYTNFNEQRTNFFEQKVSNYSIGELSWDDF